MSVHQTAPLRGAQSRSGAPRKRRSTMKTREALSGYLFASPMFVGFVLVVLVPMVSVIFFSVQEYSPVLGTSIFVGAENYAKVLSDPVLPQIMLATLIFAGSLVPIGVIGALGLALLVNQKLRGINIFRAIFFAPTLISIAAWAIVWQFMLQNNGAVNGILQVLGLNTVNWLHEPVTAMISVVIVQAIKGFGINMMIFLAALQSVPNELIEAGRIDGAGKWTIGTRIVLPMVSPEILMVSMLMVIGAFKTFAQVLLLTAGGPGYSTTLFAYYIYQQAFTANNFGYAAVLALLLFVILLTLTGFMWQLRKRVVFYESE